MNGIKRKISYLMSGLTNNGIKNIKSWQFVLIVTLENSKVIITVKLGLLSQAGSNFHHLQLPVFSGLQLVDSIQEYNSDYLMGTNFCSFGPKPQNYVHAKLLKLEIQ